MMPCGHEWAPASYVRMYSKLELVYKHERERILTASKDMKFACSPGGRCSITWSRPTIRPSRTSLSTSEGSCPFWTATSHSWPAESASTGAPFTKILGGFWTGGYSGHRRAISLGSRSCWLGGRKIREKAAASFTTSPVWRVQKTSPPKNRKGKVWGGLWGRIWGRGWSRVWG